MLSRPYEKYINREFLGFFPTKIHLNKKNLDVTQGLFRTGILIRSKDSQ